ncbi:MAG: hypothetical protein QOK24_2613 [Verrucomicrobiota bacterium]|jgi:hypothetical protein
MQSQNNERPIKLIKKLIWLYFLLLIFEGSFRKWLLPQFSDLLLVVRDPVVIAIYFAAVKAKVFPRTAYITSLAIIGFLSALVSVLVLMPYVPLRAMVLITGYGFRCNFLHLPLIFIMARVLDRDDLKNLGRWILLGMIPMALLMAFQFNAEPDAFINRTAGLGESQQITAGGGKIRPPGTFSFVSGVIFYASMAAVYLLYGALTRGLYRNWLLYGAGFALVLAIGVSGSRSVLLAVVLVIASLAIIIVVRPSAVNQFGRNLLIAVIVILLATRLPVFKEGVQILSDRFTTTAESEEKTIVGGLLSRVFIGFAEGYYLLSRAPIGGYGLGIGTNGGAKFLTGRAIFLLSEGEWGRIILESGPILGLAYLVWRTILCWTMARASLRELKRGGILAIMFFAAGVLPVLNGQFGQPTNLGFAVFICGLCLAAAKPEESDQDDSEPIVARLPHRPMARRSRYADRLHSPSAPPRNSDGSAHR